MATTSASSELAELETHSVVREIKHDGREGVRLSNPGRLRPGDLFWASTHDGEGDGIYQIVARDPTDGVSFAMRREGIQAENDRRARYDLSPVIEVNARWDDHERATAGD